MLAPDRGAPTTASGVPPLGPIPRPERAPLRTFEHTFKPAVLLGDSLVVGQELGPNRLRDQDDLLGNPHVISAWISGAALVPPFTLAARSSPLVLSESSSPWRSATSLLPRAGPHLFGKWTGAGPLDADRSWNPLGLAFVLPYPLCYHTHATKPMIPRTISGIKTGKKLDHSISHIIMRLWISH